MYRRYCRLPHALRSPARTAAVVDAIFLYAYDHCRGAPRAPRCGHDAGETARVAHRLGEFLPDPDAELLRWLHAHLLPEAWQCADGLRELVAECLRRAPRDY